MPEPRRGWGDRLIEWIKKAIADMLTWMEDNLPLGVYATGRRIVGFLHKQEDRQKSNLLDILKDIPDMPSSYYTFIEALDLFAVATMAPIDPLINILGIREIITGYLSPMAVRAAYHMSRELETGRPDPQVAWMMNFREVLGSYTLGEMLKDTGWSEQMIDAFKEISRPLLGVGELMQSYWRGELNRPQFVTELEHHGYKTDHIAKLLAISERIPGAGDLISMAVREAFHPELIDRYHYMDNFPPEFASWMQKQGFSPDWAAKYWVAHWRLPSITAGFEMLHRGEIAIPELRDLLRTADIAPIWHDPLIQIAYTPYTRVDVRRMHKLGILSDADLVRSYMDLGYDSEKAGNMAEFTILYNTEGEREATKADILKGYRTGILSREDALSYLTELGYEEYWGRYYLSIEDLREQENVVDEEIKTVETLYVNREISKTDAQTRLAALNLTALRVAKLLNLWDIARERKTVRPTVSSLEQFFKRGIVSSTEFKDQLSKRGYLPEYVEWYHNQLIMEVQEEVQDAEEKAAKEAERIQKAEIKTRYQEQKAEINYQIAQFKTQFIYLRILRDRMMTTEARRRFMATIEESKLRIVEIHRDIAAKRTRLTEARGRVRVLEIAPSLLALYEHRDDLDLQIADINATVADLRTLLVETQAAIGRTRVTGEVEVLRRQADDLLVSISDAKEQVALLKVSIAEINAEIAEFVATLQEIKVDIRRLEVSEDVLTLYDLKDATSIQISDLRSDIADFRTAKVEVNGQIRLERVSPEILSEREGIDNILVDINVEQEEIAQEKLNIATAQAALAEELTAEEIAGIEESMRAIQLQITTLETERARLRI